MTREEINKVVNTDYSKKYLVKLTDGTKKVVKLWKGDNGIVCIIGKGKRTHGHQLTTWYDKTDEWVSITELRFETDYKKRIIKRAKDAQKMLAESGLWKDIKKEIDDFLSLSDDEIDEFVEAATTNFYDNVYCKQDKFPWLHTTQIFGSFLSNKCWKSLNFHRWDRETNTKSLKDALSNKTNWTYSWRHGYDNSVEVRFDDDCARGWYSEEYLNCGNGHYYLLFDATHAIFYEDD